MIGPKAYLGKEDNFAIIMISSSLAYFLTTRPAKLTRFSFFRLFLVTIAATRRKRGVFVPAVVSPSSMKREVFGGFWRFEKNTESRRVQNIDTFKKFQIAFFVSTLSKSKPPYSHLMLTHATFQNIWTLFLGVVGLINIWQKTRCGLLTRC